MAHAANLRTTGGGHYTFSRVVSDDETVEMTFIWTQKDGSDFPWDEYEVEYTIKDQVLTQDDGIVTYPDSNRVMITAPALTAGETYPHACRIRHLATGKEILVFDGALTVLDGGF